MKNGSFSLDEVDLKILNLLQEDAKLTAKDLGDQIALSQTPVYERIRKLEQKGVIRKYVALLNSDILEKNFVVFMNLRIRDQSTENREHLVKELTSLPQVTELYHTSGRYDFIAKARFSGVADFNAFLVNHIANINTIIGVESQIVLEDVKYTTAINLETA